MVVIGMKILVRVLQKRGHLEVLKWAKENYCPWNRDTCLHAASNGHLEVLKWARENGCPWSEGTCPLIESKLKYKV